MIVRAMRKTFALLFAVILFAYPLSAQKRARVTILSTTDLHGNILPVDYYTNKPDNRGLAKVAAIIKQVRKEDPNLILLDSGDTIQGTPLAYYHNKKNNTPPDPMMLAMNALGYDAMAVGNHEYNFGLDVLNKARREAKFPWLSANTYKVGTNETYYQPYIVKEANGVRIGILGLTTAGVPNWENKPNYAGLEFRAPIDEARKWVGVLRSKEKADVVIIAMHMGLEEDLRTGEASPGQVAHENEALAIARTVPGVDVILMGHTHREISALVIPQKPRVAARVVRGGLQEMIDESAFVLLTQANYWGKHLARVDIYLQHRGTIENSTGNWSVVGKQARTIPLDDKVQPDAEIVALAKPYDEETQSYLSKVIGQSSAELTAGDARFRDNALLDLIQRVQLEAGKGDVSMVAPFNLQARVAAGPVTVRDIAGLYIYENTLVTLEVTGAQLKDALEHSARFFKPYEPGKTPAELVDDKIPSFNFDLAEGVDYTLDITKPYGSRITNLTFKGQPLDPKRKLRLVTNNYRVNGGGGYTMYKDAPVLYRSSEEIRQLIIEWLERNGAVPVAATNNWRLISSP